MNELIKLTKPELPIKWEYESSVFFVKETVFKWKNLTEDVARELWIAREIINNSKRRSTTGTFVPMDKTWAEYCEEIGSSKQVVNRWLKQWFETVHVSQNSGENEWYTPPEIAEKARATMGSIVLDPASCDIANETIKATTYFTKETNGLNQQWFGNVWMNPPYSQPLIKQFSDKLINELSNITQACVLVNNATETDWLQTMMAESDIVCFLNGRVKYIDTNGDATGSPLQGQIILYFGNNINSFCENFSELGICMKIIREGQ